MASTVVVALRGCIERAHISDLCAYARALIESGRTRVLVYDVSGVAQPDAATVDALARLQLTARRNGAEMHLRGACDYLRGLLTLCGLEDLFAEELTREARRQPEQRE